MEYGYLLVESHRHPRPSPFTDSSSQSVEQRFHLRPANIAGDGLSKEGLESSSVMSIHFD